MKRERMKRSNVVVLDTKHWLVSKTTDERACYLIGAAFEMGSMIEAGWIDEETVKTKLKASALRSGLDAITIDYILQRAIREGKKVSPSELPALRERAREFCEEARNDGP